MQKILKLRIGEGIGISMPSPKSSLFRDVKSEQLL
jgi:hypothetical protein